MSNGKTSATIDLDSSVAISDIDRTIKFLEDLKKKILAVNSAKYGSDEWWKKSDAKAIEEYKKGNFVTVTNDKQLKEFLDL